MSAMDLRLVVYEPNGPRIGVLPHPLSVDVGQPLNDLPSLRVDYSAHAVGADLLEEPCEVAVELYDARTGSWIEYPDSRFLRVQRSGDVADPTGARSYTMPGYGWQMKKIRLYPGGSPLVDGKRGFLSANAGIILRTFLNEWHARGGSPEFTADFSTAHDSAGQAWDKILTIYYAPGIDLLTVLTNLAEQGVVDWRFSGRTLQVYNADTALGRDRASGPGAVVLQLGRDVTDAPDQASLEDLVTDVYLEGESGFSLELSNPNAQSPWGRWEEYLTQGGVSNEGTARILAQAVLDSGATERVQITRGLDFTAAEYLPWADYQPGDYVRAPGDRGAVDTLRVRQITLSRDRDGHLSGNVVLNDRFLESEIRRARRTNGIVNGAVATGGSGVQPAPDGPDRRAPAAPTGLIVHTDAYLDSDGAARGLATLTWGLVDADPDGAALEVSVYEVYHRPNVQGTPWVKATETTHPDNTASIPNYNPGEEWAWKVRAVSKYGGVRGEFSDQVAAIIADDADPPPVPSPPDLETRLGVIRVAWDGRGANNEAMPTDFSHVTVWMSADEQTWTPVDTLTGPGVAIVPDQPYDEPRWFRFTAVDRSGNESAPSASNSIATTRLVTIDIEPEAVDAESLAIGVFDNLIADPEFADPVRNDNREFVVDGPGADRYDVTVGAYVRDGAPVVDIWAIAPSTGAGDYVNVYLSQGASPIVTDPGNMIGVAGLGRARLPIRFAAGTDISETGSTWTVHVLMLVAYTPPGGGYIDHDTVSVDTVQVPADAEDHPYEVVWDLRAWEGADPGRRVQHVVPIFRVWASTGTEDSALQIWDPYIAGRQFTGTLIQDGAISTDKIAANAITADKIRAGAIEAQHIAAEAVTANKIAADAIDGKTITGALIRSAASGARTEMNTSGLQVLNASNQPLVRLGYGIATGMQVRDPHTGTLVALASHIFGFASNQRTNQFVVASGYSNNPSWVRESVMVNYTAVTPRALVIATYHHTQGQGGGRLRCNVDWLIGSTLQFSAPDTEVYTEETIVEFPATVQQVVTGLTPGTTYGLRFAAQATKPWYLETRSITVIPL